MGTGHAPRRAHEGKNSMRKNAGRATALADVAAHGRHARADNASEKRCDEADEG